MEGIVDVGSIDTPQFFVDSNKKRIVYTGTLRRLFGVKNLLDAFSILPNPDVELWICGSGELKNTIEKSAEKDHRIKFYGLVDRECALMMQRNATILVNPRTSEGAYTKYSFPSKVMEYMLSGRSVIINKLPGIPNEYYKYVYCPKDESVESLAECISRVLSINENVRDELAQKARNFIINNKNAKVQMSRVLSLINSYM